MASKRLRVVVHPCGPIDTGVDIVRGERVRKQSYNWQIVWGDELLFSGTPCWSEVVAEMQGETALRKMRKAVLEERPEWRPGSL